MAFVLVALVSTAMVREVAHEWIGIALFALVAVHLVQHRRQVDGAFKGKTTATRAVSLLLLVGALLCVAAQAASSVVLSKYAFSWLPSFPGSSIARQVHMAGSHWAFALMMLHAGLQAWPAVSRKLKALPRIVVVVLLAVLAAIALWSAVQLDFASYLFLQVGFAFIDYAKPIAVTAAQYVSFALALFAAGGALRAATARSGVSEKQKIGE